MNTSLSMFLILAEELSFSRAAQRAFVTQQCFSDHIKRLEQKYGTPLVNRRPKVTLTEAGMALLESARRIRMIEEGLEKRLAELEGGASGTLRVGITFARAQLLIPRLFSRFHEKYPGVTLQFECGDTNELLASLRQNKLDCLVGISAPYDKTLCSIPLCQEHVSLLVSEQYLKHYLPERAEQLLSAAPKQMDLRLLQGLPIARNLPDSTLSKLLDRFLETNQIVLHSVAAVSEYSIQIALCAQGQVAAFCPAIVLDDVARQNKMLPPDNQIHIFSIAELEETLRTELLYHADAYYPAYARYFFSVVEEVVQGCYGG